MHSVTLVAVLVAMVAAVAMGEDVNLKVDQISVDIKGISGTMTLIATEMEKEDEDSGEDTDSGEEVVATTETPAETTVASAERRRKRRAADMETNQVMVEFVSLKEVDAEGAEVGGAKENPQALDAAGFKLVEFTFDEKLEGDSITIPNSKNEADTGIKALQQSYQAALHTVGTLKVVVYIAKEDGNITLGETGSEEVTQVMKGQVKFSVELAGWVWCTETDANCKKGNTEEYEVGAFLDLEINVKGHGDSKKVDPTEGMAMTYEIGNGNHLFLSKKVMKTPTTGDATWEDLATDYPMAAPVASEDGTTKVTVRLPPFETSILYDPSIRLMVPGSDNTSASNAIVASMGVMIAALLTTFLRL